MLRYIVVCAASDDAADSAKSTIPKGFKLSFFAIRANLPIRWKGPDLNGYNNFLKKLSLVCCNTFQLNLPCCCKSQGCPRSKASKGEAVVFYCESLATKEMGCHRLSLRVKNMTNFLFVLEVTKSLFANHA